MNPYQLYHAAFDRRGRGVTTRQCRLIACGWAREVLPPGADGRVTALLEAAEAAAGSPYRDPARAAAHRKLGELNRLDFSPPEYDALVALHRALGLGPRAYVCAFVGRAGHGRRQAGVIKDVLGNPYRRVRFDPRWRTESAVGVARAAYDDHAFDRLPILADALQDAGCEDAAILGHCRDTKLRHVRGCWVVDLVLGLR